MFQKIWADKWFRTVTILGVLLVGYLSIIYISRLGETPVNITVIPRDSVVFLDGRRISSGTSYLKPGEYSFEARRDGFSDDEITVDIGKEATEVGLIPTPASDEAQALLTENPSLQQAREAIGGQRANAEGLKVERKTPIITLLPYTDINGPFSIDYGPTQSREDGIFLLISDSSPEGRENALKWIKQQGYDPATLEIRFDDYRNPLIPGDSI